ncbi:unnamed protein product [Staurois parvus]|uniref:Uncharacterized protein n=1 Tax=Staurois parvus TaxID=386267 RepID=A0ABN9EA01_9NEOB|nr:unnamed protein product [Staurois parvus]
MVGVTKPGDQKQEMSAKVRIQAGSAIKTGTGTSGLQDTGPRKNHTQGRVCRSEFPLNNTSIISSRCFDLAARLSL